MALKCAGCGKFLRPADGADCATCSRAYHKACVALSDVDTVANGWECPECFRVKPRRGDKTNTPIKGVSASLPPPTSCEPPTADPWTEIRLMRRDLADFMQEIREEFRSFRSGITERMDAFEHRLAAVEQREQAQAPHNPPDQVSELLATVAQLKMSLNDRDQEVLLSDLDIGHLPEEKGENINHTVTVLAAKLGITIQEHDIVFAERVGRADRTTGGEAAAAGRPRRVVVRLARRSLRDDILRAARVRRSLTYDGAGQAGPPRRVYVNERLTKYNRQLFQQLRVECRMKEWRYCWTRQGRIFVRKGDGKRVFQVRTCEDMGRVFDSNNV